MCLIIDANQLCNVFSQAPNETVQPVLHWLLKGDGCVVYNSDLLREIGRVRPALAAFVELRRSGRAIDYGSCACPDELLSHLSSDDPHVIALALESGARVVFTDDRCLISDVKNKNVLSNPRGRVYRKKSHRHLLVHNAACTAARRARSST